MVFIKEEEFKELRENIIDSELNLKEETIRKPKELSEDQKQFLEATNKNSEREFEGLTKENIVPFGDRLLVKVVVEDRTKGNIYLPDGSKNVKSGHAMISYCEIAAISPKIKKQFADEYPGVEVGWRCKFNVNLALSVAGGACLIEREERFIYQYYTVSVGMIDYAYPAPNGNK